MRRVAVTVRCCVLAVLCGGGILSAVPASAAPPADAETAGAQEPVEEPSESAAPAKRRSDTPKSLLDAYKREYAVLEAEKRALLKRLSSIKGKNKRALNLARAKVDGMTQAIADAQKQSEALEKALAETEKAAESAGEHTELLSEVTARAAESLKRLGKTVEVDPEHPERAIEPLFAAGVKLLDARSRVRREPGTFFLESGEQVEGIIVRLGGIAALGVSEKGAGALAPAGGGHLKLWPGSSAEAARALADGNSPETLSLFIFENTKTAVEPKKDKTWLEVVESGGVIAWVIVWLGVAALALLLVRVGVLLWSGIGARRLGKRVAALIAEGRFDDARRRLGRRWTPAARVLGDVLDNLGRDRDQLEGVAAESLGRVSPGIERFGTAIAVFAAVAPLLGLLGTVTGMIATFDIITEHGTGDPKLLSGGISEALVTTELGLVVAIPTLLLGTLLSGRANHILAMIELSALSIINVVRPQTPSGPVLLEEREAA